MVVKNTVRKMAQDNTVTSEVLNIWDPDQKHALKSLLMYIAAFDAMKTLVPVSGDVFNCSSVSKEQANAAFGAAADKFQSNPLQYIKDYCEKHSGDNDSKLIDVTECVLQAWQPLSVVWKLGRCSFVVAIITSRRCRTCKKMNMHCNRCAFGYEAPLNNMNPGKALIDAWITNILPFGPANLVNFRKQIEHLFYRLVF